MKILILFLFSLPQITRPGTSYENGSSATESCDDSSNGLCASCIEENCYFATETKKSWIDSEEYCKSRNSYLVTFETQKEYDDFLRKIAPEIVKENHFHWIGANEKKEADVFIHNDLLRSRNKNYRIKIDFNDENDQLPEVKRKLVLNNKFERAICQYKIEGKVGDEDCMNNTIKFRLDFNSLIEDEVEDSVRYLLMSHIFVLDTVAYPGFSKFFREKSDAAWNRAIQLTRFMGLRCLDIGNPRTIDTQGNDYDTIFKIPAKDEQVSPSIDYSLKFQRKILDKVNKVRDRIGRDANDKGIGDWDPHACHFIDNKILKEHYKELHTTYQMSEVIERLKDDNAALYDLDISLLQEDSIFAHI